MPITIPLDRAAWSHKNIRVSVWFEMREMAAHSDSELVPSNARFIENRNGRSIGLLNFFQKKKKNSDVVMIYWSRSHNSYTEFIIVSYLP